MTNVVNARIKIYPVDGIIELHRRLEGQQARINACSFYARLISECAMMFTVEICG